MSWLGGICIGLAGIFLVRYSIEQGLLGPAARVVAGIGAGLTLHAGALYLRRRNGAHHALAALAGGGSIMLFAALLSALHMYELLNPTVAFTLLALIAVATMWLALLHGPLLAALGLLGAYAVPLLVGGDADAAHLVLVYVLLITMAALLLLRHVDRIWLWYGVLVGVMGWWLLTLPSESAELLRGWYLAAFVWLLYALPSGDWWLRGTTQSAVQGLRSYWWCAAGRERLQCCGLALATLAWVWSILLTAFDTRAFLMWTPFAVLVLALAARHRHLVLQAWLLPLLCCSAWLLQHLFMTSAIQEQLNDFYWYCLGSSLVYVGMALLNARRGDWQPWLPMLLLPLLFLVLTWLVTENAEQSLQWLLFAALLGGIYLALAAYVLSKGLPPLAQAWFFLGAHLAYALSVAFYLREASLTLALAAQLVSIGWLIRRFDLPAMGWLLKGVVALVLCRLTLNPWLFQYPVDVHWSLWSYGGATLCCVLAAAQLQAWPQLRAWAHGAALHLFTLTVWAELRWWLHDGDIFAPGYTAIEAGLNAAVFGALALVYHWREQFAQHLARLYRIYSQVLLALAAASYAGILIATRGSLPWITGAVGDTWLFNSLLLLFGVPVLLAWATRRWYLPAVKVPATLLAAAAGFIFINLQIRHFWQDSISLQLPTGAAELYTYSAVWLLLAMAAVLGGAWRFGRDCYRGGMLLLLLVVAKLFLVDMSDLEGLLRVASFLGMGLGLLGIAYLHRRLQGLQRPEQTSPDQQVDTR